jgi:4-hydroxy-3-methylbut-2-enyl diphosphate reductase
VVIVETDKKSGFCFGVANAVSKAEEMMTLDDELYSLGHIVHNELEVKRLHDLGLKTITHDEFYRLRNCKVLIRAHGEPPETYEYAQKNNITLVDATCPVVLKLQQRVKTAAKEMDKIGGQVIIFGHPGHAEVTGLAGQANNEAIIIDNPEDIRKFDASRPAVVFSQTTKSVDDFNHLINSIKDLSQSGLVKAHDTICRQVSNRVPHLQQFSNRFDVVIFAGGRFSSNARVLFDACKRVNKNSFFVSSPDDIAPEWFIHAQSVGICGATSTPQWLMEKIADRVKQL